jgi:hypothetical protein
MRTKELGSIPLIEIQNIVMQSDPGPGSVVNVAGDTINNDGKASVNTSSGKPRTEEVALLITPRQLLDYNLGMGKWVKRSRYLMLRRLTKLLKRGLGCFARHRVLLLMRGKESNYIYFKHRSFEVRYTQGVTISLKSSRCILSRYCFHSTRDINQT